MTKIAAGQRISVSVPATTANLGPGYDCLGLALGVADILEVETTADAAVSVTVTGEGAATLPTDATHLIARTILERWAELGLQASGLRITATNVIPHGRGMGSSAAAIVSALTAADVLAPEELRGGDAGIFQASARWEGHPDNVAPAVFGGLTISWEQESVFRTECASIHPGIVPVIAIPEIELSTHEARTLLPATVPHAVAAANSARTALLMHALANEPRLLLEGTVDYLHQEFRAPAMRHSASLIAALRAGGFPAMVSGAGPTVLVLAPDADTATAAQQLISAHIAGDPSVSWRVLMPGIDIAGARVEVH